MILADENIDQRIITTLREEGNSTVSVYESHRGLTDEAVISLSRNPPRIILTEDKDFGEWVFAHGIRDISVIFLRYDFRDTALLIATLLELLRTRLPELQGPFTTVGVRKVRIRKP
jgi:predicted nuclease of predicted toxin-antitoxin system